MIATIVQVHAHHSERNDTRAILRHGLVDWRELVQVLEAVERQRLPLFLWSWLIVRPVTSLRVLRQLIFRVFFLISIRLLLLLWRWRGLLALSPFVRIVIIAVVGLIGVRGHLTPLVCALKESSGAGVRVDAKVLELSSS